jgi:phosphoribosyl 1,2-cyclic phosphodiesterase
VGRVPQEKSKSSQLADRRIAREAPIVKFCVLASGSSGNSTLLATDRVRILIDAGLSLRELTRRLALIDEQPERLSAVLVTHEHSDHVSGLVTLARKHRVPVYMTRLTAPQIDWGEFAPALECFQAGASLTIADIEVSSFTIPHDARDPVGFSFRTQGIKLAVVTDLGYIPESIQFHVRETQVLLLESNHDLEMLRVGPYPWSVKQRVMSRVGHLSNLSMCDFLRDGLDPATAHLILGHLSEQNNHPEIVRRMAANALERRGVSTTLEVARQNEPGTVVRF